MSLTLRPSAHDLELKAPPSCVRAPHASAASTMTLPYAPVMPLTPTPSISLSTPLQASEPRCRIIPSINDSHAAKLLAASTRASAHLLTALVCHQRHNLVPLRLNDCTHVRPLDIPAAICLPPSSLADSSSTPHSAPAAHSVTTVSHPAANAFCTTTRAPRLAYTAPSSSHLHTIRPDELHTRPPR
ncbi:hypothetical protein C8R45DRAFT_1099303 [Mycena sanguinolenta]|nr:hypothetical protein C8R45DRAFT_1099303 [Mycena sanguinolenta]